MPPMNALVSSSHDDLMEITCGIGPLFLMDYFFNKKGGRPYNFFALVGDRSYSTSSFMSPVPRETPLTVFGSRVAEIQFEAHIKEVDFREQSNLIVPAIGEDVKRDNFASVRVLCSMDDYIEDDETIRFRVEAWSLTYFLDGKMESQGWIIESKMVDPMSWMTFNKRTHELTVS